MIQLSWLCWWRCIVLRTGRPRANVSVGTNRFQFAEMELVAFCKERILGVLASKSIKISREIDTKTHTRRWGSRSLMLFSRRRRSLIWGECCWFEKDIWELPKLRGVVDVVWVGVSWGKKCDKLLEVWTGGVVNGFTGAYLGVCTEGDGGTTPDKDSEEFGLRTCGWVGVGDVTLTWACVCTSGWVCSCKVRH